MRRGWRSPRQGLPPGWGVPSQLCSRLPPPGQTGASLISPALPPACPCLPGAPPTPSLLHSQICCPNQACGQSSSSWLRLTFPGVAAPAACHCPESTPKSFWLFSPPDPPLCLGSCCPQGPRCPSLHLILPDPAKGPATPWSLPCFPLPSGSNLSSPEVP